jgi:hypothetical protein
MKTKQIKEAGILTLMILWFIPKKYLARDKSYCFICKDLLGTRYILRGM